MASASAVRLSPSAEKHKLKLELLRGSRLKLESLPVSVVVHEHLVHAGCMFFGTTTRRTLTRLHRHESCRGNPHVPSSRDVSTAFHPILPMKTLYWNNRIECGEQGLRTTSGLIFSVLDVPGRNSATGGNAVEDLAGSEEENTYFRTSDKDGTGMVEKRFTLSRRSLEVAAAVQFFGFGERIARVCQLSFCLCKFQ